ncbi:hypothetical protein D3C78_1291880 [compost metagenome]
MRTELAGVLARDVVLVGIVFENHQVGEGANKAHLANFLLEAQEEHDAVITRHIHFTTEVAAQVALVVAAQPAQVALAMSSHTLIQAVQDGPLFFLHQKQNFHRHPYSAQRPKRAQGVTCCVSRNISRTINLQAPEQLVATHSLAEELVFAIGRTRTPRQHPL